MVNVLVANVLKALRLLLLGYAIGAASAYKSLKLLENIWYMVTPRELPCTRYLWKRFVIFGC